MIYSAIVNMAVGFYGYLFCVLCVCDLLNVASAVCQYMKQDIAFKVVKSDVVLSGTVNGITDGDSKYFPGIPGAKTIEMSIECIYKGPSMNSAVKIYGVGEFNNILSFKFRLSHLLQCIIFFQTQFTSYCLNDIENRGYLTWVGIFLFIKCRLRHRYKVIFESIHSFLFYILKTWIFISASIATFLPWNRLYI